MKDEIKLDKNCYDKFIFRGALALESYFDFNGNRNKYMNLFKNFCNNLRKYRALQVRDEESKEKIVNELKSIIITLGKENFSIDEDGYIEYIGEIINEIEGDEK